MDDDIFEKILRTESVFKDQATLGQAWVPKKNQKLLARDQEIKKLTAIHRPIIETEGAYSVNTLVLGTGGIGKTLTIRFFGRRFREAMLKRDIKLTIEYYDCLQHRTKSSILRNISERLHYSAGHGYSDNEIMEQILKELRKREESLLII
ncbi:MAG: AAA family ATPase, partial [Promethearchaeota archaeon]